MGQNGDTFVGRVEAIAATWAIWIDVGAGLDTGRWHAPTRCAGWDVAAVYAHVAEFPAALAGPLPEAPAAPEYLTAGDILSGFNRPGGVAQAMAGAVADAAVAHAAAQDQATIVGRFRTGRQGLGQVRDLDPATPLPWPACTVPTTVGEGLRIVLMESVVHLLDVLCALDREPDLPAAALRDVAILLAEMAPPTAFIEAATGRAEAAFLPLLR